MGREERSLFVLNIMENQAMGGATKNNNANKVIQ